MPDPHPPTPSTSGLQSFKSPWWPSSVGRRLALGFGVLVILMLLALSQAALQLRLVIDQTSQFATSDMQRLLRVQSLSLQTEGVGSAIIRLMNAPRENRVKEYTDVDERNRRVDGIIESLGNDLRDTGQEETLKRLRACRANYGEAFLATVDQVEAGDLKAAARALNERLNPALKAMLLESNTLLRREQQRIESQLEDAQTQLSRAMLLLGGVSLLLVALAAWLAWRTTQSVVGPLTNLESAARRIASGDYASRVPFTAASEVDRVGEALNTMAEAVDHREKQIIRLAYEDALTGLPNRTALLQPVQDSTTGHNSLALLDVARLKTINETLGYGTGDELIKESARRLAIVFADAAQSGLIGQSPLVARLSGGLFAASFFAQDRTVVEALRQSIERATSQGVECGGHHVDLNLIGGYADTGASAKAMPVATLLRNAEVALHTAKRSALGHAWHTEALEAARLDHLNLVSDLRHAVAASELQMWLQPKFSLVTGRPVGAEALVRWQHPNRGFISPVDFVPFAEQTGHITLVTDWMLREAVRTLKVWAQTHPELSIAVNVSTRDLQDPGFADRVGDMVRSAGIDPRRLRIEITESGLMEDADTSIVLLHALRRFGIALSIDDFGTGYSSFAYLQKLPVSELKIDRAFVDRIDTSPGTQKLVKAMIEMGHGLDLVVTAEGVETDAEREILIRMGCDVMQGYLASKPLHGKALSNWLDGIRSH